MPVIIVESGDPLSFWDKLGRAAAAAKEIASLTWRMVTDARGQIGQAIAAQTFCL
jgi:hypothetical protein